jgi:glyoxylase-like metal-dependent hydrolase (beta-lactamase superfamily II)
MSRWKIGSIAVDRVAEIEGPLFSPAGVFTDFDRGVLDAHWAVLVPAHYDPELGLVKGTIQSYVIRTSGLTILVDTCCGNSKQRPAEPPFHDLDTPFLDRLAAAGVDPLEVDIVLNTHLHVDHVGWNTRLENGVWVPTFPNATYFFSKIDLDFIRNIANLPPPQNAHGLQYADSIEPILAAGRVRLLTGPEALCPGLEIEFASGHTPGHIILRATSGGKSGLFVGDALQHPLQVYRPDWNSAFCSMPDQARSTRRRVLADCADTGALMFPAHFASPYAFRIKRVGDGFALDVPEPAPSDVQTARL